MIRFASGFRMSVVASLLLLVLTISTSVISKAAQVRQRRGLDPQTQLLNNYRKYVDRYIRISGETWKYDDSTRSATHSFTLKNIAGEIGVHEATVSRITSAKYVQTEWGIYALKHFFSNSIAGPGTTGSRFSKEGVKEIVREIIEQEGGAKGLSDQKIV